MPADESPSASGSAAVSGSGAVTAPPLSGMRVLELASLYAGPLMGAMLGDLGADVVKVEPHEGDPLRIMAERALRPDGSQRPTVWTVAGRSKRMTTLDTRSSQGLAVLHRLTAEADIVLLNHTHALLKQMGCTYEEIRERNPRAVVVLVSGWGATGPFADRGANGTIGEAFAGVTDQVRDAEGRPRLTPLLLGDTFTALTGVIGTLAACYHRDARGGEGQFIDVAIYESLLALMAPHLVARAIDDEETDIKPADMSGGLRAPIRTSDGSWIVSTAYTDAQITRLLEAVGVERSPGIDLAQTVIDWAAQHTVDEVMTGFETARITASPLHDLTALLAHPQTIHREAVRAHPHPRLGSVLLPEPAPRLGTSKARVSSLDAPRSTHSAEVFAEWLSMGADEIEQLYADGIVFRPANSDDGQRGDVA